MVLNDSFLSFSSVVPIIGWYFLFTLPPRNCWSFKHKLCLGIPTFLGFPDGWVDKESAGNAGDPGSIPGSGRPPGEGNDNPLQDSCLGNAIERGPVAWWATVHGVANRHNWATKNTGVSCPALLQGIFPTQGSNPCILYLLHWQAGSKGRATHSSILAWRIPVDEATWWASVH